jgi:hypothetical protein
MANISLLSLSGAKTAADGIKNAQLVSHERADGTADVVTTDWGRIARRIASDAAAGQAAAEE